MKKTKRTLAQFEEVHGQAKVKSLKKQLEVERAKVAALADVQHMTSVVTSEDCHLRFGVTADRHIGSLYHNAAALKAYYDYCESIGIPVIYDAGDIIDGWKVYRGQEFELRDIGFEDQIARVEKDSPRNVRTCFITGNHDASFKNLAGVLAGKAIQSVVKEYEFIGEEQARVRYDTPNGPFEIMLIHPGGGSSYAITYRPQKIVESLEGGTKPNFLGIGHHHKADMMPSYRNVCTVSAGTFQAQTPFMARQGLAAHVGGWVFDVFVGENSNRIKGEFIAFF
jgi:DNA polymerase II small subunit/DNA polymerase delta subunit B